MSDFKPIKHTDEMPFGKHKGTVINSLPSEYLSWLVDNLDGKPDIEKAAQTVLDSRDAAATGEEPEPHVEGKFRDASKASVIPERDGISDVHLMAMMREWAGKIDFLPSDDSTAHGVARILNNMVMAFLKGDMFYDDVSPNRGKDGDLPF